MLLLLPFSTWCTPLIARARVVNATYLHAWWYKRGGARLRGAGNALPVSVQYGNVYVAGISYTMQTL